MWPISGILQMGGRGPRACLCERWSAGVSFWLSLRLCLGGRQAQPTRSPPEPVTEGWSVCVLAGIAPTPGSTVLPPTLEQDRARLAWFLPFLPYEGQLHLSEPQSAHWGSKEDTQPGPQDGNKGPREHSAPQGLTFPADTSGPCQGFGAKLRQPWAS